MKFRPLPAKEAIRILETLGFEKIRQKGSHVFMRHPDGRATVVPAHRGEEIGRGLLSQIIKDTKLTREEFLKAQQDKKAMINETRKKYGPPTRQAKMTNLFGKIPYDPACNYKKHRTR